MSQLVKVSLHFFCERPISSVTSDKEFPAEISFEKRYDAKCIYHYFMRNH